MSTGRRRFLGQSPFYIIHIGLLSKDYSIFCFIITYTLRLHVETTVSSFRGLQRSGNHSPKHLGIQTALERQQSKTQHNKCSKDVLRCYIEIKLDEKRVSGIRQNKHKGNEESYT